VKTLSNEQVRVQPTESSICTIIIKALMEKNTEFHTFKSRQDRNFRVVIRNLHQSTEIQDIKRALIEKGHKVTNVWNAKQRNTNRPLPLHFIHMKPHFNNKEIYQITTLLNTVVKVEAPHAKRAIPQCMRGQK
jgi:predicted solute-binding protein